MGFAQPICITHADRYLVEICRIDSDGSSVWQTTCQGKTAKTARTPLSGHPKTFALIHPGDAYFAFTIHSPDAHKTRRYCIECAHQSHPDLMKVGPRKSGG
jgi:hypothetical protein